MYGIKVILKSRVENGDEIFYEEMILTVREEDEKLALKKAEEYVKGYCKDYLNADKKKVFTEIYDMSDVFEAFEEDENGVREVYSKYINLPEEE